VTFIIHALREAAGERPLSIYLTDGRLVSPQVALEHPLLAAASNWHALAHHVAQSCEIDCGLLVDLGSTTCDIIPLIDMRVAAHGSTDTERLIHGELVYTGVVRSPVCAVTAALPYRGNRCPVAQELFATTLDAYLVLRHIDEDPADLQTADGRPATRENARARLARTICADAEHFDDEDARSAAEAIKNSQIVRIEESLARVCGRLPAAPRTIVVSGQGEFLLREMLTCRRRSPEFGDAQVLSLSERLGEGLSRVAPAYALARLAQRSEP
jgi:probable H4MPT-linked C1 transfer pathway protein